MTQHSIKPPAKTAHNSDQNQNPYPYTPKAILERFKDWYLEASTAIEWQNNQTSLRSVFA